MSTTLFVALQLLGNFVIIAGAWRTALTFRAWRVSGGEALPAAGDETRDN